MAQSTVNETKALCDFVFTLPDRYKLMTVKAKDIQIGDVITITPACYDDIGPMAQFAETVKVSKPLVGGEYIVINGFVFEPEWDELIMRKIV